MTGRAPSSGRQKGFTLVELLVVMALLSLLMLGLASAMSTVSQTQESPMTARRHPKPDAKGANSLVVATPTTRAARAAVRK